MSEAWTALIPLVVVLLSLIGGGIGYVWQKRAERRSGLSQVRQELYREYLFAQQRVLTSCIRSDDKSRKESIDAFRSFEAALYVAAPETVAKQLGALHSTFVDYTRCIRCKYEPRQAQKFGQEFPQSRLLELETAYLEKYQDMLARMREDTLGNEAGTNIDVIMTSASKEIHE